MSQSFGKTDLAKKLTYVARAARRRDGSRLGLRQQVPGVLNRCWQKGACCSWRLMQRRQTLARSRVWFVDVLQADGRARGADFRGELSQG